MPRELRDRFEVAPLLAVFAAGTLAAVLQWTNGHYNSTAIFIVVAMWFATLAGILWNPSARYRGTGDGAVAGLLVIVLGVELALLATEPPTVVGEMSVTRPGLMHVFQLLLVVVAFVVGAGTMSHDRVGADESAARAFVRKYWLPTIVLLHFVMGCLVIALVREPTIDVWQVETDSARALISGINPYGITFPDPSGGLSPNYPERVMVDGRLNFGFVYPPLALLMCLPGYLLGGDVRWSTLVAMDVAALLIAYARPDRARIGALAAAAFLFMPRTFYVMDRAWTDSFVALLTAAICFTAFRKPRLAFLFIGMYVCLKQHMFIGIPALFLLIPRPIPWSSTAKLALKGGLVAAVVTLPLIFWDPKAFARSALDIREVFRTDSLGLIAHLHNAGVVTVSKWAGILAIIPVAIIGLRRAPRHVGGFAMLAGATHFTLYLFSTHAFCNEYYNVISALFCAAATWGPFDGTALLEPPERAVVNEAVA